MFTHFNPQGEISMVDISAKGQTLRQAEAAGKIIMQPATLEAIKAGTVAKGEVLAAAKLAGIMAAKQTGLLIPLCHPLLLAHVDINFNFTGSDTLEIRSAVKCLGATGVEMEALTAVAVAALTVYDMAKAQDRGMRITDIHLSYKSGGKSGEYIEGQKQGEQAPGAKPRTWAEVNAAVLVLSDSTFKGEREDTSGKWLLERLQTLGVDNPYYEVLPDDPEKLRQRVTALSDEKGLGLIVTSGGTGLGPKDFTPESLKPLFDKEVPGLAEGMRSSGALKTPFAWLSRSLAGVRGTTLILCLPGSLKGTRESWEGVEPALAHALQMMRGGGHDQTITPTKEA